MNELIWKKFFNRFFGKQKKNKYTIKSSPILLYSEEAGVSVFSGVVVVSVVVVFSVSLFSLFSSLFGCVVDVVDVVAGAGAEDTSWCKEANWRISKSRKKKQNQCLEKRSQNTKNLK